MKFFLNFRKYFGFQMHMGDQKMFWKAQFTCKYLYIFGKRINTLNSLTKRNTIYGIFTQLWEILNSPCGSNPLKSHPDMDICKEFLLLSKQHKQLCTASLWGMHMMPQAKYKGWSMGAKVLLLLCPTLHLPCRCCYQKISRTLACK